MIITFNKAAKQIVYNLLRPKIKDRTCPFCGCRVGAKNFAGAIHFNNEPRFMDRNIVCLFAYTDYIRAEVSSAK